MLDDLHQFLAGWAKDARTSDARKRIVEQMLSVGEEALDAGAMNAARELGKLASGKSVYAASSSEITGIPANELVRAVLAVPTCPPEEARFQVRAILLECDVPPEPPS